MLVWDAAADKVNFEFAHSKFPAKTVAQAAAKTTARARVAPATKTAARTAVKKSSKTENATTKKATKSGASGKKPSAALAAVIGEAPLPQTEVMKKLWDYIKLNNLQDPNNKRNINADSALLPLFGKAQITMFELAGIAAKNLTA